jgi:hypothetical protein
MKMRDALIRAVKNHGHDYNCSAARGMESDCHCGWLEVKQLVKKLEAKTPVQKAVDRRWRRPRDFVPHS